MDCTEKKIKSNLNVALEQTAYNLSTIQPKSICQPIANFI